VPRAVRGQELVPLLVAPLLAPQSIPAPPWFLPVLLVLLALVLMLALSVLVLLVGSARPQLAL